METINYTQQAQDFLTKTQTKFSAKYLKNDKYFPDDTDTRDIFRITLRRGNKKYVFRFGQSIKNVGQKPTAYSVLACLTKYDPGTFENFCGEFGYDTDSRTAEKTYKAIVKEYENLTMLYNDEELALMQEIN